MSEHTKGRLAADDGDGEHFGLFAEDSGEAVAYLIEPAASARYAMLPRDEAYETDRAKAPGLVRLDVTYARYAEHKANARRLVACWNACEGISTETLESNFSDLGKLGMMADRDELIEALQSVVTHIPKYVLRNHGVVDRYPDGAIVDGGIQEYPRFVDEVAKARALLAKHAPKVKV